MFTYCEIVTRSLTFIEKNNTSNDEDILQQDHYSNMFR